MYKKVAAVKVLFVLHIPSFLLGIAGGGAELAVVLMLSLLPPFLLMLLRTKYSKLLRVISTFQEQILIVWYNSTRSYSSVFPRHKSCMRAKSTSLGTEEVLF